MITSLENIELISSVLVAVFSIAWFIVDAVNLRRELARESRNPDRLFGYIIGLVLAILGGTGVVVFALG